MPSAEMRGAPDNSNRARGGGGIHRGCANRRIRRRNDGIYWSLDEQRSGWSGVWGARGIATMDLVPTIVTDLLHDDRGCWAIECCYGHVPRRMKEVKTGYVKQVGYAACALTTKNATAFSAMLLCTINLLDPVKCEIGTHMTALEDGELDTAIEIITYSSEGIRLGKVIVQRIE